MKCTLTKYQILQWYENFDEEETASRVFETLGNSITSLHDDNTVSKLVFCKPVLKQQPLRMHTCERTYRFGTRGRMRVYCINTRALLNLMFAIENKTNMDLHRKTILAGGFETVTKLLYKNTGVLILS